MRSAATPLSLLAAFFVFGGCRSPATSGHGSAAASPVRPPPADATAYESSPNVIVGYVLAVDLSQDTVIVDLTADPRPAGLVAGAELLVRTRDLQPTARLAVTPHLLGRTLATRLLEGTPAIDDEVVLRVR